METRFDNQLFIVNTVNRAGIPKPFLENETHRYFPCREFHGLILHYGESKACYRLISEGKTVTMAHGDLLFIPQGTEYETSPLTRTGLASCYYINFDTSNKVECKSVLHRVNNFTRYSKLFSLAVDSQTDVFAGKSGSNEQLISVLYSIISELKKELVSESFSYGSKKKVAPAIEFIETHPEDNRSVDELAALCGLKAPFFRRCFGEATGLSPVTFRNNAKISKAVRLIETTDKTLPEIASLCGIEDYYYFCRLFKAVTGIPPGKYIKRTMNNA